jgi:DNA gyrase subunit A
MVRVRDDSTLLVVSERGLGKRTEVDAYRMQKRGGKGVINLKVSERTGRVVSIKAVTEDEQLMLITRNGVVNRQRVDTISLIGRATQGVKLVNLDKGDVLMDVARIIADDEEEELEAEIARAEEAHSEGGGSGASVIGSGESEPDMTDEDRSDPEGEEM